MTDAWSTKSGKRLMVPRSALDVPTVQPLCKRVCTGGNALVKPEPPKAKSLHLTSFLCEACGGNHWWGHGNGYAGGTLFRCDNPKCKRAVPKVSTEEAETRMANCPHCIGEKMYHASPDSFASKSAAYCAAAEILDEACTVNDAWALGL